MVTLIRFGTGILLIGCLNVTNCIAQTGDVPVPGSGFCGYTAMMVNCGDAEPVFMPKCSSSGVCTLKLEPGTTNNFYMACEPVPPFVAPVEKVLNPLYTDYESYAVPPTPKQGAGSYWEDFTRYCEEDFFCKHACATPPAGGNYKCVRNDDARVFFRSIIFSAVRAGTCP